MSIFLMNDIPPCSNQTCPEMRASEWQYLCAVHEPPKSCCAIDYCNHTLDWAANVLTSPKHFPSRLALGGEAGNVIQSMRQLTNIFRRVYRIFAHAWFQHRDVFWSVEATYGLYMLFKVVCDEYRLIPEDSYTIPPEAEGAHESSNNRSAPGQDGGSRMQILQKENPSSSSPSSDESASATTSSDSSEMTAATTVSTGATTRRHKNTPSTGSHVGTIAEGQEEEEEPTSSIAAPKNHLQPQALLDQETTAEPSRSTSASPPKKKEKEPSPDRLLPKLDFVSTVPQYEPRAPEDPTPTGTVEDVDPLSINTQAVAGSSTSDHSKAEKVETPIDQIKKSIGDDEEEEVTSPSGGSIRTGGPDVLQAILGHLHEHGNKNEKDETTSPINMGKQKDAEADRDLDTGGQMEIKIAVEEAMADHVESAKTKEEQLLEGKKDARDGAKIKNDEHSVSSDEYAGTANSQDTKGE